MATTPRDTHVLDAVVTLIDDLLVDFDVVELLADLAEQCTRLLDATSATVLLAVPQGPLHLLAATSDGSETSGPSRLPVDEGPCLDAYTLGSTVSVADLGAHGDRWPRFVPAALDAGCTAVHALPLHAAGSVFGVLGLFGDRALDDDDVRAGEALARIATMAILQHRAPTSRSLLPALRTVLADRVVVEQAKGVVRGRLDVTIVEAFDLVREYARRHATHLTAVSQSLVHDPVDRRRILAGLAAMHEGYDL